MPNVSDTDRLIDYVHLDPVMAGDVICTIWQEALSL